MTSCFLHKNRGSSISSETFKYYIKCIEIHLNTFNLTNIQCQPKTS